MNTLRAVLSTILFACFCWAIPLQRADEEVNNASSVRQGNVKYVDNNVVRLQNFVDTEDSEPLMYQECGPTAVCVPYDLCSMSNRTILENGSGLLDVRIRRQRQSSSQTNYCDDVEVCCELPPSAYLQYQSSTTSSKGCGFRNSVGTMARIRGGNTSGFGEFPWMVMVLKDTSNDEDNTTIKVYQCGGSLIHRRVVLTAAHCVNDLDANILSIRAGEWDVFSTDENLPHQSRLVDRVILHEQFQSGPLFNDVALLILKQPIDISDHIDVICLPDWNTPLAYSRCIASGWGKDGFDDSGKYQQILKSIELPLIPKGKCQSSLRKTRLGKFFALHGSFVCAGGQLDRDTCLGDGGSPLVCPLQSDPERFAQVGIVSWGIGCGDQVPAVYANVKYLRRWIDEQMIKNELSTFSYEVS